MQSRALVRFVSVSFLVSLAACKSTSGELRARFAKERACPADRVRVVEAGGDVYRASGCEQKAQYVCGSFVGTKDIARSCQESGLTKQAMPDEPRVFPERADRPPPPR